MTAPLGFVGLGRMGANMSARLLAAGQALAVHDTSADAVAASVAKGAKAAGDLAAVARECEIVFLSLPTPDIIKSVVLGKGGLLEGKGATGRLRVIVDLSTTGPSAVKLLAGELAPHGVAWVEAPVSGGIKGATEGTLAVMISGPEAEKAEVLPLLKNFGKIFDVGTAAGQAQVAKLANNLMAAAAIAITSEGMAMATKAGIDPRVMLDIINVSSGRNSASQDKFPKSVLDGSFNFGFATGLSYKDVRMCVDEAEAMGIPMVVGAVVRQMLAVTQAKYGANSDFTSMARVLEEWAGVEIRAPKTA